MTDTPSPPEPLPEPLPDELAERWHALGADARRRLGPAARLESRPTFERLLGADLGHVLVHRTPFAGRIAAAVQAEAVTLGSRILGGPDRLNTATPRGAALVAHEAAHAVQRAESDEGSAQAVEATVLGAAAQPTPPRAPIDPQVIAERVYRRLLDDLRIERERMAWPA